MVEYYTTHVLLPLKENALHCSRCTNDERLKTDTELLNILFGLNLEN